MIIELGLNLELIRVTAEYSNAVLVAMLPYFSDAAQKLELPVPTPIKAEQIEHSVITSCRYKDGSIAGGSINIKGGWWLSYAHGYVDGFSRGNSFFGEQDPGKIPKYYGPVRMSKPEAIELARKTLLKLGIPLERVFADLEPQVPPLERVGTNVIPRYNIKWINPVGGNSVEMEVNADAKRVEMFSLRNPYLEKPTPKVNVVPPMQEQVSVLVNPDYAGKLIPITLKAIDEYGAKLQLPLPRPLTTNHVAVFSLHDNNGWPHADIELTNGWKFVYRNSMVNGYYAPDNLCNNDNRPKLVKEFIGKWNLTTNQAITLIKRTVAKMNYPTNLVLMDFKPRVLVPALPGIPRYNIYWWAENAAHDDLVCKVEAEVDADKGELKSFYFDNVAF
jgi:hypothetical protein